MDGGFKNCLRLHGLRHEHREAQHGGGGGGDDGANPHLNLRLEYKTIQFDILGMSVSQKMTKLQNAWKICIFCNSEKFLRGTLEKKFFFQIFSIVLFYFWRSHEPIGMEWEDIRMHKN